MTTAATEYDGPVLDREQVRRIYWQTLATEGRRLEGKEISAMLGGEVKERGARDLRNRWDAEGQPADLGSTVVPLKAVPPAPKTPPQPAEDGGQQRTKPAPVAAPRHPSPARRTAKAEPVKPSPAERLLAKARDAADLRAYRTHPDVAALHIERVRAWVDGLIWTGLGMGLLFTMGNVAHFAGAGSATWSVPWLIAWLLDPMVSLCLVGVLIAESTLARYQVAPGRWVRCAKWGLLTATYVMNTWTAYAAGDASLIVLHSVPPAVVFVMAEAITDLRERLTEAVFAAHRMAAAQARSGNDNET